MNLDGAKCGEAAGGPRREACERAAPAPAAVDCKGGSPPLLAEKAELRLTGNEKNRDHVIVLV
jgi:hypothetical protein